MGIYIGTQRIDHVYKGTTELSKIRIGEEMTSLIEGDDFVKAKWLVGDGSAKINTLHNINEELGIDTKVYLPINTFFYWYRNGLGSTACHNMVNNGYISGNQIVRVANNSLQRNITQSGAVELTVTMQNNIATVNGTQYALTPTTTYDQPFFLYDALLQDGGSTADWTTNGVKCSYFKFMDDNGIILNLTPCRLLHAIPATFDANGIARNADECGMYNSVNGLFYGNVGSGSFSVSNV